MSTPESAEYVAKYHADVQEGSFLPTDPIPKNRMNIREATVDDIDRILEIEQQSLVENAENHYEMDSVKRFIPDSDEISQYERLISEDSQFDVIVATNQGRIIGFGTSQPNGCQIHGVFVSPSQEHQGVGSKLLDALIGKLNGTSCDVIYVISSLNAESFYKEHGFERIERTSLGQNAPIPVIKMERSV